MPAKARPRRPSTTLTRSGTALLALAVPLGAAFAFPPTLPSHDGSRIAAAGYEAGTTPRRDVAPPPPDSADTDATEPGTEPTPPPTPPAGSGAPGRGSRGEHPAAVRIPTTGSGPAAQLVGLAAVLLIVGGLLVQLTRKRR